MMFRPRAKHYWTAFHVLWCALAVLLLVYVAGISYLTGSKEIGILLVYGLFVLSFPVGLLIPYVLWATDVLFGWPPSKFLSGTVGIVNTWLIFVVPGYLQWFLLVPKLFRRLRAYRDKNYELARLAREARGKEGSDLNNKGVKAFYSGAFPEVVQSAA